MKFANDTLAYIEDAVDKLMPEESLLVLNVLNGCASDAERLAFVKRYLDLRERVDNLERQTKQVSQACESDAKCKPESNIVRTIGMKEYTRRVTLKSKEK